jgi:hypothetical protein
LEEHTSRASKIKESLGAVGLSSTLGERSGHINRRPIDYGAKAISRLLDFKDESVGKQKPRETQGMFYTPSLDQGLVIEAYSPPWRQRGVSIFFRGTRLFFGWKLQFECPKPRLRSPCSSNTGGC